jgi:hypothetical protein
MADSESGHLPLETEAAPMPREYPAGSYDGAPPLRFVIDRPHRLGTSRDWLSEFLAHCYSEAKLVVRQNRASEIAAKKPNDGGAESSDGGVGIFFC